MFFVLLKARGAMNAILQINQKRYKGVVTNSSGNHGQALAWAATMGALTFHFQNYSTT